MVCYVHDPDLARLLAGNEEALPEPHEMRFVGGLIAVQALILLAIGVLPW